MGPTVSTDVRTDSVETSVSCLVSDTISFSTFYLSVDFSKIIADDQAATS